jgi:CheY-like chemotaxis protein
MIEKNYSKLHALVVDDFESFRIAVSRMLMDFGIGNVDSAASSAEALRFCQTKAYNIILCDQNLGKGKSGQQILEVLRHRPNPNSDCLFVLVSAESNKSIIMAAYDYEPDAYLTKPITAHALNQRLERLFAQRLALAPVYAALKDKRYEDAVTACRDQIASDSRYSGSCQKILGQLLLELNRLDEAEKLYRDTLELRQLDWAMLGMAQVKRQQGDGLSAQQWLEEIIQLNPLCLKAYDLLGDILAERGDHQAQQRWLQQVVDISPLAILRQQSLGAVALKNNDLAASAGAYRRAVKLGENSIHDTRDVHSNFARASIQLAKLDKQAAKPLLRDALKALDELPEKFGKTLENRVESYLLEAQLQQVSGEERRSRETLAAAQKLMVGEEPSLSMQIELAKTLRELGDVAASEKITEKLLADYAGQEAELQQIDCLLDEPRSAKNKALVAKINKEGIAHYEAKAFLRAVESFNSALQELPQHIGLRLNIVQALLGQSIQEKDKPQWVIQAQQGLDYVKPLITPSHPQYRRYRQLDELLRAGPNGN